MLGRLFGCPDGDIGIASGQAQTLIRDRDIQLDQRVVAAELQKNVRQDVFQKRVGGGNRQLAFKPDILTGDAKIDDGDAFLNFPRGLEERLTLQRWRVAGLQPVKQADAPVLFKSGYTPQDGAAIHPKFSSRCNRRAGIRDGDDISENVPIFILHNCRE